MSNQELLQQDIYKWINKLKPLIDEGYKLGDRVGALSFSCLTTEVLETKAITNLSITGITSTQATVSFSISPIVDVEVRLDDGSGFVQLVNTGLFDTHNYDLHDQTTLVPNTSYTVQLTPVDGSPVCTIDFVTETTASTNVTTYPEIAAAGLANNKYPDDEHYLAEWLYQNPTVRFWNQDTVAQTIEALPTPTASASAIALPAPSGGDDTAAVKAVIDANPGAEFVGSGTYQLNGLTINNTGCTIFDMPSVPFGSPYEIVGVNATDVSIYNSPIDCQDNNSVQFGYQFQNGAHRPTLIDSGVSNIYHTNNGSAIGVRLRAVDDFYIGGCEFNNIINDTSSSVTARANSIWMNSNDAGSTSGGIIFSNTANNHQSNGTLKDSEFLTIQSYTGTSVANPTRVFANRVTNAGKRMTKHQEDNALVLSNAMTWDSQVGPLGTRYMLANVAVQSSDNIFVRNSRIVVDVEGQFDYIFALQVNVGTDIQDNVHYDCNDIQINGLQPTSSNYYPILFRSWYDPAGANDTGYEATNSSFSNNNIYGTGDVKHHYSFAEGIATTGGSLDLSGNSISIPFSVSEYQA